MSSFGNISLLLGRLSAKRRLQSLGLIVISLASGFLQYFLLLCFFPLISLITTTSSNKIYSVQPAIIKNIANILFPLTGSTTTLLPYALSFLLLVLVSTLFKLYENYFSLHLSAMIGRDLSSSIYSYLLNRPYLDQIAGSSSQSIKILVEDVDLVVVTLSELYLFVISASTTIGIVFALFTIQPIASISLFSVIATMYIGISIFTRRAILHNSNDAQNLNLKRIKLIQESMSSTREIRINRLYNFFGLYYTDLDSDLRLVRANSELYSTLPRILLEGFLLALICLILAVTTASASNSSFAFLGTFALGAQRLLPSINTMYSTATTLRRYNASLINVLAMTTNTTSVLDNELPVLPSQASDLENFKSLSFTNVSFSYPRSNTDVFNNVSFRIAAGDIVVIMGPSGSGKSTLVDLIMGLIAPNKGSISFNNHQLYSEPYSNALLAQWQSKISHVPQKICLFDDTIANNVAFAVDPKKIDFDRIHHALHVAQLDKLISSLDSGIHTRIGEQGSKLSGGQAQRLALARAIYRRSDILILDESTSALDYYTEAALIESVCNLQHRPTIILVSHRIDRLSLASQTLHVENQCVYSSTL